MTLILKVLDPNHATIRDVCYNSCTNILRYLVEIYPMISFNHETQKLALGTSNGMIVIFDVRTASKWQSFEACKSPISALALSPTGDKIVSYSCNDGILQVWNIDLNVFTNFLGSLGSNKPIQTFSAYKEKLSTIDVVKTVTISWASNGKCITLKPGLNQNSGVFTL